MNANLSDAISTWESILGRDGILTDARSVAPFARATFPTSQTIPAILFPSTADEVVRCVETANRFRIKIYTVSSGRNWGFGSAVPVRDGHVIMSLTRMNRILEYNQKLGYVVLEPGVTYKALHEFLSAQPGERFWIDATGSSNLSSVIGNALERGHGQTPYCDHIANTGFFEVVTGAGKLLSTGFGAFANSKNCATDRWGLGPALDGLFSQSNFGIVTKMSVWLMPAPEYTEAIQFGIDVPETFLQAFDELQNLRLRGILKTGPHYGNVYFSLGRIMQYPWEATQNKTPLPPHLALEIAHTKSVNLWNGMVSLYGTRAEVSNAKSEVLNVLKGKAKATYVINNDTMDIVKDVPRDWARDLNAFYHHLTGGPGGTGLGRCYWRMKTPAPTDLDAIDLDSDGCGVICVPVSCPADSRDISIVTKALEEAALAHGFEPFTALFGTRSRSTHIHSFLVFDRGVPGEGERALKCEAEQNRRFFEMGYQPHRLSISQMNLMTGMKPESLEILRQMKSIFDPLSILAEGRYVPGKDG